MAKYVGLVPMLNDGLPTGSFASVYTEPIKFEFNISYKDGSIVVEQYGLTEKYDLVIKTSRKDIDIGSQSVFWIYDDFTNINLTKDTVITELQYNQLVPKSNLELSTLKLINNNYNYTVGFIGNTLNTTTIYLKRISNNNG